MTDLDYAKDADADKEIVFMNTSIGRHAQCPLIKKAVSHEQFLQDWPTLSNGSGMCCLELDNDIYHAISDVLSTTVVNSFDQHGPRWFQKTRITKEIPAFSSGPLRKGHTVHESIECGGARKYLEEVAHIVSAECGTAAGELSKTKKAQDKIAEELDAAGKTVAVTEKLAHELIAIEDNLNENTAAKELLDDAIAHEVSCIWKRHDGHHLRCRFDMVTADGIGVDFKTTSTSRILNDFWKSCITFNYAMSSAIYQEGGRVCGITDGGPLRFVVISTVAPFECQVVEIPVSMVDRESKRLGGILDEIKRRTETNDWLPDGYGSVCELWFPSKFLEENDD